MSSTNWHAPEPINRFFRTMTREIFGPVGNPRYQENYAQLIQISGGHLLELIKGVLDRSKIEAASSNSLKKC